MGLGTASSGHGVPESGDQLFSKRLSTSSAWADGSQVAW